MSTTRLGPSQFEKRWSPIQRRADGVWHLTSLTWTQRSVHEIWSKLPEESADDADDGNNPGFDPKPDKGCSSKKRHGGDSEGRVQKRHESANDADESQAR